MTEYSRAFFNSMLRGDFGVFCQAAFDALNPGTIFKPNWHIEAIAYHLQQCAEGHIRRLIITVPPRNLKSHCASVAFPAWLLGQDPTARIVCASYSNELSTKLSRDCRALMQNPLYKRVFPRTRIDPKKNTELEFMTTNLGYRLSTSVEGTLTGRGGNYLIIDDPLKPQDAHSETRRNGANQWWDNTLSSRLDDKVNGVIILIMQRLHMNDLVGHVLEKEDWVHLNLPAIATEAAQIPIGPNRTHTRKSGELLHPEHEPREVLDKTRESQGSYVFSAQYQQEPIPPGGNLVRWEWFRTYEQRPYNWDDWVVQSWDTASKTSEFNDYSVCTTWSIIEKDFYLLDVYRERLEFPALKQAVIDQAKKWYIRNLIVEDMGSGIGLIQELKSGRPSRVPRPFAMKPEGDKVMRMGNQTAKIESGHLYLPVNAPWLPEFRKEFLTFPNGRYDDQVNSTSQFLAWIDYKRRNTFTVVYLRGR